MSVIGIVLLVAAVVLLAAFEWPRLGRGAGMPKRRKRHMRGLVQVSPADASKLKRMLPYD